VKKSQALVLIICFSFVLRPASLSSQTRSAERVGTVSSEDKVKPGPYYALIVGNNFTSTLPD
jgi:hypothetical protein